MATNKIQVTKNYRLFRIHDSENRPLDIRRHKKLRGSMERYGFLHSYPVVVKREGDLLIVKDGQHRLAIAEELGLSVCWVEEAVDFDIAVVNSTARTWGLGDYAKKHAANGLKAYEEGMEFAHTNGLPLGTAFALLAGTTTFTNCQEQFIDGTFRVKDRKWADAVAGIYVPLVTMSASLKTARFIEACMAVCRVSDFDPGRLLQCAKRCRDLLLAYSTKDAFLDMLEKVYNFGRSKLVPLKVQAAMAMRERSAVPSVRQAKAAEPALA